MPTIGHYATLRNLILEMERDLQISGLSDIDARYVDDGSTWRGTI